MAIDDRLDPQKTLCAWDVKSEEAADDLMIALLDAGFIPSEGDVLVKRGVEIRYERNGGPTRVFLNLYLDGNYDCLPEIDGINDTFHKIQDFLKATRTPYLLMYPRGN